MDERSTGLNDAGGCAIDWSWLTGERISCVSSALDTIAITFESGLVLNVRALLWQGKPFLAFDPHKKPG